MSNYQKSEVSLVEEFNFLVVDDHDFMLSLVREVLISAGAGEVETAMNGEHALTSIKKLRRIDFIVTDFNMPKMNGLQLLKQIRTGGTNAARDVPVIMLSGFNDEALLGTAFELDAHGFIVKPVSRIGLIDRMNKIFMGETHIKPVEEYQAIPLPTIDGAFEYKPENTGDTVSDDMRQRAISLPLDTIPAGSIIVEDVVTAGGVTLLREGNRASSQLIDFLMQTQSITKIDNLVVAAPQ